MQRLARRDWIFLAVCAAVFSVSLAIALTNFTRAFPEASIEFRYGREASKRLAEDLLRDEGLDVARMRSTAMFDTDDPARIFLERTLGLDRAQVVMKRDVRLWSWHHRWFRPLQEEEYSVDVAPTGELTAFSHTIPEARALPDVPVEKSRAVAEAFLRRAGAEPGSLRFVDASERRLPHRVQRIFTWESPNVRPAGAPYRTTVTVDGGVVTDYARRLRVPDSFRRSYQELRSRNRLAGQIDTIFLGLTLIASLVVFIIRVRRRDIHLRFLLVIAVVSVVLVTGVSLNSFPSVLASYDTTTSYPAFLAKFFLQALLGSVGTAMFLLVVCGSGEVLYRERLPQHLALPRLWTLRALGSRRVFLAFVLAYTMVAFFLAYQVVFYLTASKFGAWAPADIPYDDILNSAVPWIAVLFAGFFPAFSEEFMSRAFSIPFFERLFRSRIAAIVVAGFIWGFGHATYPNQPFYIRGVEVGLAGVLLGFLFFRFGLLPLLIWHYTVDAVYTALLLFRSHNTYYVVSAALSSFVFAIPMIVAIVLYLRRGGFEPDDDLSNATLPVSPAPPAPAAPAASPLPPPIPLRPRLVAVCAVTIAAAAAIAVLRPASPSDAVDYRVTREAAKRIAKERLASAAPDASYARVIATAADGFRSWNRDSKREDGGSPGGFDSTAAEHLLASGLPMRGLVDVFRTRVEAATWTVRFFTPMKKEEYFVEVDPRTARAIGFHKYQEEGRPGPQLDQAAALAIAMPWFGRWNVDPAGFELKEALSFQQPARRDWLFHFQERRPLADEGFRRITIRVAGATVTQFATTVKVPEAVYREASTQTIASVSLLVLRIAGAVALLALIVAGFVAAAIHRRPRWGTALRWTLLLAPLPLVGLFGGYESALFGYDTSVRWDTFFTGLTVDLARTAAVRIGALFLAIAAVDAAAPHALAALGREGRRRFGRHAAVAAITAVAAFTAVRGGLQLLSEHYPAAARVGIDLPDTLSNPLPAATILADSIFDAVAGSAAVVCFIAALSSLRRRNWIPDAVGAFTVFCLVVDPGATPRQIPLMLLGAAALAATAWAVTRHLLRADPLAWPLAIFSGTALSAAIALAANRRADLEINALAVAAVVVLVLLWSAASRPETTDA